MVATILRLKFSTMRHQLRRELWRVLVLVGGAIWSLSLLPLVLRLAQDLSYQTDATRETALILATSVIMLGWLIVPLLITGLDDTLDPGRFTLMGANAKQLMPGMTVATFLTLPAFFTLAVFMIAGTSWRGYDGEVIAHAMVGSVLTLIVCVFTARVITMWASRLLSSRRSREVSAVAGLLGLLLLAPVGWSLFRDGLDATLEYLPVLVEALGRTPVAAATKATAFAANGDMSAVWWRYAMVVAWIVILHGAWRANIAHILVNPLGRGGGARLRSDTMLKASYARKPEQRAAHAVFSRVFRSWFSDPRYLTNLVGSMAFPLLFFVLIVPIVGPGVRVVFVVPMLLAGSIGWGRHNDVAMDSSALWLDIVSGSLGKQIMKGRMQGTLAWATPAVAVTVVGALAVTGRWDLAPALVGATAGGLSLGLALSAVASVVMPYRAPAPGENPFGAEVGSVGAGLLAQLFSSIAAWVVTIPVVVPLWLAITVDARWGWVGLAAALAIVPAAMHYGAKWSGNIYDRRSGKLLAAIA